MANAFNDITITHERRPCYIGCKAQGSEEKIKAIFHRWIDIAIDSGYKRLADDKYCPVAGLVEFENGQMMIVSYEDVHFADGGDFGDIAFLPLEALLERTLAINAKLEKEKGENDDGE